MVGGDARPLPSIPRRRNGEESHALRIVQVEEAVHGLPRGGWPKSLTDGESLDPGLGVPGQVDDRVPIRVPCEWFVH